MARARQLNDRAAPAKKTHDAHIIFSLDEESQSSPGLASSPSEISVSSETSMGSSPDPAKEVRVEIVSQTETVRNSNVSEQKEEINLERVMYQLMYKRKQDRLAELQRISPKPPTAGTIYPPQSFFVPLKSMLKRSAITLSYVLPNHTQVTAQVYAKQPNQIMEHLEIGIALYNDKQEKNIGWANRLCNRDKLAFLTGLFYYVASKTWLSTAEEYLCRIDPEIYDYYVQERNQQADKEEQHLDQSIIKYQTLLNSKAAYPEIAAHWQKGDELEKEYDKLMNNLEKDPNNFDVMNRLIAIKTDHVETKMQLEAMLQKIIKSQRESSVPQATNSIEPFVDSSNQRQHRC